MNKNWNIFTNIVLVLLTLLSVYGPAVYFVLILFAFSEKYYAVFPLAIILGYGLITYLSVRKSNKSLFAVSTIGVFLLGLNIVGEIKDYTAYNSSGPGPWEWINISSPYVTVLLIIIVIARYILWSKKDVSEQKNELGSH